MADARARRVGHGTERDECHNLERNRLEKALEIGLEETFPASDAVAVIEPKPRENRKSDPRRSVSDASFQEKTHSETQHPQDAARAASHVVACAGAARWPRPSRAGRARRRPVLPD